MSESEAKDRILKFLLDEPERTFNAYGIMDSKILEDTPLGTIELLIERIGGTLDEVAYVNINDNGHFIASNNLTPVFLKQGGFTKYEQDEAEQKRIQEERDNIAFEKSKIDLELAKKMLKEYPKTKWFARIGFIIGTGLALLKLAEYLGLLQSPN